MTFKLKEPQRSRGIDKRAEVRAKGSDPVEMNTFGFIRAVSGTILYMIVITYHDKPLIGLVCLTSA